MRRLNLDNAFLARIGAYRDALTRGGLPQPSDAKSDYWDEHSRLAAVSLHDGYCLVDGQSGFYIPEESVRHSLKRRFRSALTRSYRDTVLRIDRILDLSEPHHPMSLLSYENAYDLFMSRDPCIDYDESPYRFDPLRLAPLFKTSRALKTGWFLRDRYRTDPRIVITAFHHAMFSHFMNPAEGGRYLEIGAGSGNLASFFHYYNKSKIVIVDLPETILFSMCFLRSIFPKAPMLLPHEIGDSRLDAGALAKHDFIFLLPSQIDRLPDDCFDIAVNTFSFQEMTPAQIGSYFQLAQRACKPGALWCNHNRVEKLPSRGRPPVRAMFFPYAKGNEVLVDEISRFMRLVQLDDCVLRIERVAKP